MDSDKNKTLENEFKNYSMYLKLIFDQIDYYISKKNNNYEEIVNYI